MSLEAFDAFEEDFNRFTDRDALHLVADSDWPFLTDDLARIIRNEIGDPTITENPDDIYFHEIRLRNAYKRASDRRRDQQLEGLKEI